MVVVFKLIQNGSLYARENQSDVWQFALNIQANTQDVVRNTSNKSPSPWKWRHTDQRNCLTFQ